MESFPLATSEIEIERILIPYSWTRKYVIKKISLQTTGKEGFVIDFHNNKGKELEEPLGKR